MRLGFIGAGAVALDHAAVAEALGARIVAASARSPQSPRWLSFTAARPHCEFEPDAMSMAARSDIDAIILCLPWKPRSSGWIGDFRRRSPC